MIDIVLATYNGEKHLREQLDSIIAQTYCDWHLWIGDDVSSDNTMTILEVYQKQYPDKISVFSSQQRLGIIRNFSNLLEMTSAPYVMFSDQDDRWFPDKMEKSLGKMKQMEDQWGSEIPLLVHTDLKVVDEHLKIIAASFQKRQKINPKRSGELNALLVQNVVMGCTMLFNRNLIDVALPIPPEAIYHDSWLALVASACGYVGYLEEPTLYYRQHEHNFVGSKEIHFRTLVDALKEKQNQHNTEMHIMRYTLRAYVFSKRFQTMLDDHQKEMLESFISLKEQSLVKELYWRWKYNFWKHGFWPNVGLLIATMRMGRVDSKYRLKG